MPNSTGEGDKANNRVFFQGGDPSVILDEGEIDDLLVDVTDNILLKTVKQMFKQIQENYRDAKYKDAAGSVRELIYTLLALGLK
jgi:hypothetical protein